TLAEEYVVHCWVVMLVCVFFFSSRRRHTRFSRDWSSDVCSSDLLQQMSCRLPGFIGPVPPPLLIRVEATCAIQLSRRSTLRVVYPRLAAVSTKNFALSLRGRKIGRAHV